MLMKASENELKNLLVMKLSALSLTIYKTTFHQATPF